MQEIFELLQRLARERFYGAVTLKFEAGRIVVLKKEETFKPTDLSEKPRSQHANEENE
jgi:hypothetical protein